MKVKQFIHWSPSKITGIEPIKTAENKYGKEVYFYVINDNNLHLLKQDNFANNFKEQKDDDFKWYLNRWAVCVVNKAYLFNRFINSDIHRFLNPERWTKTNVVL